MVLGIISRAAAVVKGRYRLIRKTRTKKHLADLVSDDELFGTTVWLEAVLLKRGKKASNAFLLRNVVLTTEYVSYGNTHGGAVLDKIRFWDMAGVVWKDMNDQEWNVSFRQEDEFSRERKDAQKLSMSMDKLDFAVCTTIKGYFRGRTFVFRTSCEQEREVWGSSIARVFAARKALPTPKMSTLEIWRRKARWLYLGDRCQIFVASLIFLNFLLNIAESQFLPAKGSDLEKAIASMNLTFTVLFTVELVINMFATLVIEFLRDAWNWFDTVVVLVSLISVFLDSLPGVSVLRLLRAFRVFRLFKRIPSLRQILVAINQSIPPMLNAFALVTLLTSIYAIMAVTFFKDHWPELFGDFFTSSFTMFQIMTGDQWGDIARELFVMTSSGAWVACFFVSYQLVVALVLVNVVIAVLLEEFAKAAAAEKETGSKQGMMEKGWGTGAYDERCPLERLAVCLQNFTDSEDYEMKIHIMFLRLTHSAGLMEGGADEHTRMDKSTFQLGLAKYGMVPPINFTDEDWSRLIIKEGLLGDDEKLGYVEFGILMRRAFRRNQLREVTHVMELDPKYWTRGAIHVAMMSVKSMLLEHSYGDADVYCLPPPEEQLHPELHEEANAMVGRLASIAPPVPLGTQLVKLTDQLHFLQQQMGEMEKELLGREIGSETMRRSLGGGDDQNPDAFKSIFQTNLFSLFSPQQNQEEAGAHDDRFKRLSTAPAASRRRSDPQAAGRLRSSGQPKDATDGGWNLLGGLFQSKTPNAKADGRDLQAADESPIIPVRSVQSSPAITPPYSPGAPLEPVEISSWRPARVQR